MKLQEWQAILGAYGICLLIAETSAAPLAVTMAWGIAITYALSAFQKDSLGTILSGLFSGFKATTPSSQTAPAANTAGGAAVTPPSGPGQPAGPAGPLGPSGPP